MKKFAEYVSVDEIDARVAEIDAELKTENANVEELSAEFDGLKARREELADESKKAILRAAIEGEGKKVEEFTPTHQEDKHMNMKELRSSKAYVEAFANGLKEVYRNGKSDFAECRAAITTELAGGNGTADIPVPSLVDEIIGTAWEKDGITQRVKKSYIKGVLRIGVEIVASDAVVHAEGAAAPSAETLIHAIVSLTPETIKKWVQVSDEVLDMDGEAFLRDLEKKYGELYGLDD
mgnify:CR=1 FL=1